MPNKNKNLDWFDYVIKISFICVLAFFSYVLCKSYQTSAAKVEVVSSEPTPAAATPAPTTAAPEPTPAKTAEPIVIVQPTIIPTIIKEIIVVEVEKEVPAQEVLAKEVPAQEVPAKEVPAETKEDHTFSFSFTFDSSLLDKAADSAIKGLQSIDFKRIGEKITGIFNSSPNKKSSNNI